MTEVPKIVHERLGAVRPSQSSLLEGHPDANLLTAFVERTLSPTERDGVLEHLSLCRGCREVVDVALPALEIADATVAVETEPDRSVTVAEREQRSWLSSWTFSWANLRWATGAVAIAVLAAVVLVRPGKLNQPPPSSPDSQARVAEPASSAVQIASSSPPAATLSTPTTDQVTILAKNAAVASAPDKQSDRQVAAAQVAPPPQPTDSAVLLAENRLTDAKTDKAKSEKKDASREYSSRENSPAGMYASATAKAPAPTATPTQNTADTLANSPATGGANQGAYRGSSRVANETVEVASAEVAASTSTASLSEPGRMARAESPTVEIVKAKPALKEMDKSVAGANTNKISNPDAGVSSSIVYSQPQDFRNSGNMAASASVAVQSNATWAIAGGALQRSVDNGQTWQSVLRADHPLRCYASRERSVWVGGAAGTLFRSTDGGATWDKIHASVNDMTLTSDISHIDILGLGEIAVKTGNGEIWKSADGGQTWKRN